MKHTTKILYEIQEMGGVILTSGVERHIEILTARYHPPLIFLCRYIASDIVRET